MPAQKGRNKAGQHTCDRAVLLLHTALTSSSLSPHLAAALVPQEDAALAVEHVDLLQHHAAVVRHVDAGAPAASDQRFCEVHACLLEADDAVLPTVLQLAALEKGLAVARSNERMLAARDDSLPQGCAGGLILLQATVARLRDRENRSDSAQCELPAAAEPDGCGGTACQANRHAGTLLALLLLM